MFSFEAFTRVSGGFVDLPEDFDLLPIRLRIPLKRDAPKLDVQVFHFQSVSFDELATALDVFAH